MWSRAHSLPLGSVLLNHRRGYAEHGVQSIHLRNRPSHVRMCARVRGLRDLRQCPVWTKRELQYLSAGWMPVNSLLRSLGRVQGGRVSGTQGLGAQVDRNTQGGASGIIAPPQCPRKPVWQQDNPAPHSKELTQAEPRALFGRFCAATLAAACSRRGGFAAALSLAGAAEYCSAGSFTLGAAEATTFGLPTGAAVTVAATPVLSGPGCVREQASASAVSSVSA